MPEETPTPKLQEYQLTPEEKALFDKIQADSNAVVTASNNQAAGALRMLLISHGFGDMSQWVFAADFSKLTPKEQSNG